jgi:hypothetical protein
VSLSNTYTRRTYYDYLTMTFLDHFDGLPAGQNAGEETPPRTLDSDRYYDDSDSNQSSTCARLAVEFYNQQQVRTLAPGRCIET